MRREIQKKELFLRGVRELGRQSERSQTSSWRTKKDTVPSIALSKVTFKPSQDHRERGGNKVWKATACLFGQLGLYAEDPPCRRFPRAWEGGEVCMVPTSMAHQTSTRALKKTYKMKCKRKNKMIAVDSKVWSWKKPSASEGWGEKREASTVAMPTHWETGASHSTFNCIIP